MRVDFNVPYNGRVRDDYKILAALPTIRFLSRYGAKIILATHLAGEGKSKGKKLSTKPLASYLGKILGKKVLFAPQVSGPEAERIAEKMREKEIVMLENLRFDKREEKGEKSLAKELARLAEFYVNDAFAVSHRNHCSVAAIKKFLPAYGGLLLEKELENLNKISDPVKPLVVIIGGSKIATKISLLKKLEKKAERILIGGALANNFLAAASFPVGRSLFDPKEIKTARKFKREKIILPVDVLVSARRDGKGRLAVKKIAQVGKNDIILDIGPETVKLFAHFIKKARTLIWNGPLGKFELEKFRHGTLAVGRLVASRSSGQAFGVAGGGETIEALRLTKMADYLDWISTGGGAMLASLASSSTRRSGFALGRSGLEFLAGEKLPGIEALKK